MNHHPAHWSTGSQHSDDYVPRRRRLRNRWNVRMVKDKQPDVPAQSTDSTEKVTWDTSHTLHVRKDAALR